MPTEFAIVVTSHGILTFTEPAECMAFEADYFNACCPEDGCKFWPEYYVALARAHPHRG